MAEGGKALHRRRDLDYTLVDKKAKMGILKTARIGRDGTGRRYPPRLTVGGVIDLRGGACN